MNTSVMFFAIALYPSIPFGGEQLAVGHHHHHKAAPQTIVGEAPSNSAGCCQETPSYGYPWYALPPQAPKVPPCGYFPVTIPLPPPSPSQAQICVQVPADATLKVNGQTIAGAGKTRLLTTPVLTPGKDFKYVLEVEYQADGGKRVSNRDVNVLAGTVSHIDFNEPTAVRTVSAK